MDYVANVERASVLTSKPVDDSEQNNVQTA